VLLSDALLERFKDEEIEAVFAHELGHANGRHMLLRMLCMAAPLCLCHVIAAVLDSAVGSPPLSSVLVLAYVVFVFGKYARRLEHEADVWACHILPPDVSTGSMSTGRERFADTMMKLSAASQAEWNRGGWLHPSMRSRLEFLNGTLPNPHRLSAFRLRSRVALIVMLLAVASPLLMLVFNV